MPTPFTRQLGYVDFYHPYELTYKKTHVKRSPLPSPARSGLSTRFSLHRYAQTSRGSVSHRGVQKERLSESAL